MDASQIRKIISSILKSRMNSNAHAAFPSNEVIIKIIKKAKQLFKRESSLLNLYGNFVIVGDIHGNLDDLLRIFERCGYPPKSNYLFLGDYVDRGSNSPEVIILLFCLKILYPSSLFLIRGNHECESITTAYGFKDDCERLFGSQVYNKFMKCFMYLSYAAVINRNYLCVHGGISPYLKTLDDIAKLQKPMVSSDSQLATDLVWSDPNDACNGFQVSFRGSGFLFNDKKLNKFLKENGLKKLIRSHESCMNGIEYPLENCITVFSNTDYCEMYNDAAVIILQKNDESFLSEKSNSKVNSTEISSEPIYFDGSNSLKLEVFSPLDEFDLKKRRVLVPEFLLEEPETKESITDLLDNDLYIELPNQSICVF